MNKPKLKSYAPQARKDFIAAVTARANLLGISDKAGDKAGTLEVAPAQIQGDVTVIAGLAWLAKVSSQRDQLIVRIRKDGFAHTMEAIAYTWFNRFAALRYMELHDYLGHGHRALSSTPLSGQGGLPDILTHATDLTNELPGLNAARVTELKLAGNRDGELYRMLLVAQCNALSRAMPFLFERIDDETELLLPDNLLRSDSVIAKLVEAIPESDWAEVEIIGWLYQFYISEKKDQVIGKVVKSEDIPAATQLFTPNWIVQYLVQNSVGRLWLMANPQSTLANEWPYYITPAEQTPEVQAPLDALIQTRVREDGDTTGGTLSPESITVLDPACGSGHILVVAYDVLKAIYLERGYQPRAIPRLILEKNLYGLDIDDRAAQMAGFALLMKARADDRRLFNDPLQLNVLAMQGSKGLSVDELATHLAPFKVQRTTITALVETFEHAKTFGSLIQIPYALKTHLAVLPEVLTLVKQSGELYASAAAGDLLPLVQQAQVLAMQFDAVVANPPYMGSKFYGQELKAFVETTYRLAKGDLYTCFMMRSLASTKMGGLTGMITIPNWMFLSSYEELRTWLFNEVSIDTFSHNGRGVFGSDFGSCAFTLLRCAPNQYKGRYKRLFEKQGSVASNEELSARFPIAKSFEATVADFKKIPGSPVAYWVSDTLRFTFFERPPLSSIIESRAGMATGDNATFVRGWFEVNIQNIGFEFSRKEAKTSGKKWFPYANGGESIKWYGNNFDVVNWKNDGEILQTALHESGRIRAHNFNLDRIFSGGVTWSLINANYFSVRYLPEGFLFSSGAPSIFCQIDDCFPIIGFLNSPFSAYLLNAINPTVNNNSGDIDKLPYSLNEIQKIKTKEIVGSAISISKANWDAFELSWSFSFSPLVCGACKNESLSRKWGRWNELTCQRISELLGIEEEINRVFINAYGLQDELTPEVPESQITLTRADREKDSQRLISYAIGCMMGRYSLDEPGLIYAHAGNVGFESGRYVTFPADADGIVPITDELWFADDACSRIREFLRAVWGQGTLEENMAWLAESLGAKPAETPDETVRRYIADKFYKDHLQTYKKRPIYWLFSSGKQGAFQALVYLHRYHEGTLARVRAEYVVPLTGKIQSRVEMLQKDALAASSTAARNKLAKEVEKLKKKHVELLAYDEQLRHYADMRITLDLDDGVKVNYGKFGDLLEGVKAVTGGGGAGAGDE